MGPFDFNYSALPKCMYPCNKFSHFDYVAHFDLLNINKHMRSILYILKSLYIIINWIFVTLIAPKLIDTGNSCVSLLYTKHVSKP